MSYQQERLAEIADALREVEGSSDPIPATEFAARVRALKGAGGKIEVTCRVTSTNMTGWPYKATVYDNRSGEVVVGTISRTFDDANGDTFTFEVPGGGEYYVLFEFDDGQHYREQAFFKIETVVSFNHMGAV